MTSGSSLSIVMKSLRGLSPHTGQRLLKNAMLISL
jgi:hypothetical protein